MDDPYYVFFGDIETIIRNLYIGFVLIDDEQNEIVSIFFLTYERDDSDNSNNLNLECSCVTFQKYARQKKATQLSKIVFQYIEMLVDQIKKDIIVTINIDNENMVSQEFIENMLLNLIREYEKINEDNGFVSYKIFFVCQK